MSRFVIFAILFSTISFLQAQTPDWKWVEYAGGISDQKINGVSVDETSGGIFAVGNMTALSPEYASIGVLYGAVDGFVAKYDSLDGSVIWAFNIGGVGNDAVQDVSVDPAGDIYITGYFEGANVEFRGVSGPSVQRTSVGGRDAFVAKYNPAGQLIWVVSNDDGTGDDEGNGIFADAAGVVMTGTFTNGLNFEYTPWVAVGNGGDPNAFAIAISAGGIIQWGANVHGNGESEGVAVIRSGTNTIFAGTYESANMHIDDNFGNNSGNLGNPQGVDIFLASIDGTGANNWTDRIRGNNTESLGGMAVDGANFYLTGGIGFNTRFPGILTPYGASANQHFFLSRHAVANGSTAWVVDIPTVGGDAYGLDITHDGGGNLYAIGNVESSLDLSGFSVPDIVAGGVSAIGILSFDDGGNFSWAKEGNGVATCVGNEIDVFAGSDAVAAGGWFTDVVNFDTIALPPSISEDAWVGLLGGCEHGGNIMPSDQSICTGLTPLPLNATSGTGGGGTIVYLWQESTDSINFSPAAGTNTNEDYTFPGPLTDTMYYRRLVSSTGCLGDTNISAVVTIVVDQNPSAAAAGLDQQLCGATVSSLAATPPTVGIGNWAALTGGNAVVLPANPNSTVNGLGIGINQFEWTISNGACPSNADTMEIVVDETPSPANAGPDQLLCVDSALFGATPPLVGMGEWLLVSGTGTPTSPNLANSPVIGMGIGTNLFEWVVSNGICPATRDTIEFIIEEPPSPAVAGSDQQICQSSTVINATSPAVGTGNWSLVVGTGMITSMGSATTGVSGLGFGTNVFVWTVTNGTCLPNTDTLTVTVDVTPSTAQAGIDQQLCEDSTVFAANIPVNGTGAWTTLSGSGVIADTTSPTSDVSGLGIGSNQFIWTIANGVCPATVDTVEIVVDADPGPANAGVDQEICADSSVLAATVPSIGQGAWTTLSGSGVLADTTLAASSVSNLSLGTNIFLWTVSNGVCPSVSDTVSITVEQSPGPSDAGLDQQLCADSTTLNGNTPVIGMGAWTTLSGTGVIADTTSPTSDISGLSIGSNQFIWTIANGVCPATVDTVEIMVDADPGPAVAGVDQVICADSSVLAATVPAIGLGAWTTLGGSGVLADTTLSTSSVTSLSLGSNIFLWTVSNGVCPSVFDTVSITVEQSPSPSDAGLDQQLCADSTILNANIPVIGTGAWTTLSGTGVIADTTSPTSDVSGLGIGSNQFIWTITNGVCPATVDTTTIEVFATPSPALAGNDQIVCMDSSVLTAATPTLGTGTWSVLMGNAVISNPALGNSSVSNLGVAVNQFVWTVSNGPCPVNMDTVELVGVLPPPIALVDPDFEVCGDTISITANDPGLGFGAWNALDPNAILVNDSTFTTVVYNLGIGQNQFVWTISDALCPSTSDTLTVIRFEPPTPANAGPDQLSIQSQPVQLAGNTPAVGLGVWSVIVGQGMLNDIYDENTLLTLNTSDSIVLAWTISNGLCPVSSDEVVLKLGSVSIPTAFSPNGDGRNEIFVVRGFGNGTPIIIQVFNRWGNLVFESNDYQNNWAGVGMNGDALSDDTYYVLLTAGELRYKGYLVLKR